MSKTFAFQIVEQLTQSSNIRNFSEINPTNGVINTISGPTNLKEHVMLFSYYQMEQSLSLIMLYTLQNQREIC